MSPRLSLPRPGLRMLLLAGGAFALSVPILAVVGLRIFDDQLIRRTEAQLIGQSVLIGETWRALWLREQGIAQDAAPSARPPFAVDENYYAIEPRLQLGRGVLDPVPAPTRFTAEREGPAWRAGEALAPILQRAVRMNLSAARMLDERGCVVASSGGELAACLDELPEVERALDGAYAAVLRHRYSDDPPPGITSMSRRGRVRVYTALPVFSDGRVVGVVRLSRTALDPAKALWFDRFRLLATLAACAGLIAILTLFLSRTLARPLRALTENASAIARGEGGTETALPALAPRELEALSDALARMIRQLSDRAAYIEEFASNVSHELKTPLTGIRGAAELLRQQWEQMSDAERERFLGNIEEDSQRMERLVSRLLHLARIQSAPEHAQEIELWPFLTELAGSYGPRIRLPEARPPLRLRIPPDHLESALRNLIENALRHGGDAPVELEAERLPPEAGDGERIRLRVRDHGPGISEGNRERVFQRFFTTERDRGGTGLGLAIARAVAETRGGTLRFTTGGEGTCFELTL